MNIEFKNSDGVIENVNTNKVMVNIGEDVTFIISVDKFNNLVVQKQQYGAGESGVNICPRVSNEIALS